MAAPINPIASSHLPSFITAPGETDVLMVVSALILAISVLVFGLLFLRLHSLPERMAHGAGKMRLEIVAVLCLIALLTHIHAFWIAALLLALVDVPDFGGWFDRIAGAVERIAGLKPGRDADQVTPQQASVEATGVVAAPPLAPGRRSEKSKEPTRA